MRYPKWIYGLLFCCGTYSSLAQEAPIPNQLDGVKHLWQETYNDANGNEVLTMRKEQELDTNSIVTEQKRYQYQQKDTGKAVRSYYFYTYNPRTRRGSYYTEYTATEKKEATKQKTDFKAYKDHRQKEWVKHYKTNSQQVKKRIQRTFDANGAVLSTETTNYETSPSSSTLEKVQRNDAGNILRWESFDDDGDTKTQARAFTASYKDDTLLLESSGYLYFQWTGVKNRYNGKGELKKQIQSSGNRQSTGKIKKNRQTITWYKDGKPCKLMEKQLNKKTKTVVYTYSPDKVVEQVTTPEKSYAEVKTYTYLDSARQYLSSYTETKEGKPFVEKTMVYDTATWTLQEHIEIEYRTNGKDWKTVHAYNNRGNLLEKRFYVANRLTKKDVLRYEYFPEPEPEVEEEAIEEETND